MLAMIRYPKLLNFILYNLIINYNYKSYSVFFYVTSMKFK